MTPDSSYIPLELSRLPKLRVLNFAFCRGFGNLHKDILKPFNNLEEMAFHSCDVRYLEEGVFDNFTNLRLLNFACNQQASVPNIINVLSADNHTNIEYLVMDMVGFHNNTPVRLGRFVNGECYRIWNAVRYLSIRGTIWESLENITCFKSLVSLAAGFNSPLRFAIDLLINEHPLLALFEKLRYVDLSHLFVHDEKLISYLTGCDKLQSWIPPNLSYFPERIIEWEQENCSHAVLKNDSVYRLQCKYDTFSTFTKPPCLTYLKTDHISYTHNFDDKTCIYFTNNNLRYWNYSYKSNSQNEMIDAQFLGLNYLEILDFSSRGLQNYDVHLTNVPNLKELYLCDNNLASGNLKQFNLSFLRILDLSENKISHLPPDIFSLLASLETLNLNDNHLQDTEWLVANLRTLNFLHVKGNDFKKMSGDNFRPFEHRMQNTSLRLDIRDNDFLCGCDQHDFITWLQNTDISFIDQTSVKCKDTEMSIFDFNISTAHNDCFNVTLKITMGTVIAGIVILLATASILLYKYRWSLKWKYYKFRYVKYKMDTELRQRTTNGNQTTFSTFIIYPHDDNQITHWVARNLRNKLESEWKRKECFIRGRNDIPGRYEIDNIVEGLTHSQTALWVICPAFFDDRWCEMAANFAFQQLGVKNNAFVIMDNRFEQYRIPKQFANLLNPKWNILKLRYTDDEDGQRLFWATLADFIPQ